MEIHKIRMKNACAVRVCFRILGSLFNDDNVVIDMDSYNFVGFMADDIVLGEFHENGYYEIIYIYNRQKMKITEDGIILGNSEKWKYEFQIPFLRDCFFYDFEKKLFRLNKDVYFSFEELVTNKEKVEKCLQINRELIDYY